LSGRRGLHRTSAVVAVAVVVVVVVVVRVRVREITEHG
jgi:hypothetical protein